MRCTRTHFSVDNIYRSLMWPVDRAQPHEAAVTSQPGSEVPLATPVDPTTCTIVLMPANSEQFVVKLPQGAGSESVPLDHDPPLDVVVRLPNDSPPESEKTATESIDPEHLQSSPTGPSLDAVAHPLHPASQSRAPSNGPPDVEQQQEKVDSLNQPSIISEECIEPSGSNSTTHEVAVSDNTGLLMPATASPPLKALEQPLSQRPRRDKTSGRNSRHNKNGMATQRSKNTVGPKPPSSAAARTESKQPLGRSPARANIVQNLSHDNTIPALIPVNPISARPTKKPVGNIPPNPKTRACAVPVVAVPVAVPATAVERDPAVVAAQLHSGSSPFLAQHSATSQQMTARSSPTPLRNTPVSQSSHPRALHDQSSHPRHLHSPTDELVVTVMDSTQVTVSGGFSIPRIVTKLESLWFTIENVPATMELAAIERIVSPFGEVKGVRLRAVKQSDNPAPRIIEVQMATYREAVSAIHGLDGREILGQCLAVHLSLARSLSKRMIRDTYVHVFWPVPSKTGYAGYSDMKAAQKAVSKADGSTMRNHWITANVYEGIPILGAHNVRFTGLPTDVGAKFWNKFGPTEGTMFERPNYQAPEFGVPAVRRTLECFGKITDFNVVPPSLQGRLSFEYGATSNLPMSPPPLASSIE
ncbi:hypothetical protein EDB85DRAFT_259755 [Lactarius pseudohatsudake]|nr:hypothetical protein EDB85DRAFT_259755 [Lactarius pseudohatsudake]